ncbi:MAG: hypothetical protein FGM26_02760 [Beijerinckiaceae bacterium]|nr:hypothetical protein [Beijerinckiaceae bacterium]
MEHDADFSTSAVKRYNASVLLCNLSPAEFLVWHGLVVACSHADGDINYYYAASIADVARAINIQRETVRRALINLEKNNLAKRVNDRWVFVTLDAE